MTRAERDAHEADILRRFKLDPSMAYSLGAGDLALLASQHPEHDIVVDAILSLAGASPQERAEMLGCEASDIEWADDQIDDTPVKVSSLFR